MYRFAQGATALRAEGGGIALRAMSFIMPPSAALRSLSTHKRQVLRATFSSSMLPAHPLPGGGWRAQRDGRGAAGWAAPRPGFIGFKRFRFLPPIPMCSSARDDTAPVISTAAKRSGEISRRNVTSPMVAGDLWALRFMRAQSPCHPYRHVSPLEMTHGWKLTIRISHKKRLWKNDYHFSTVLCPRKNS